MININRLKIYVAEFTNESQLITIGMFDIAGIIGTYFVGLTVDSSNTMSEFTDFDNWKSYDLVSIDEMDNPSFKVIKDIIEEYTGIKNSVDNVINLLLDEEIFYAPTGIHLNRDKYCREMYLRSVINHKTEENNR